MLGTQSRRCRWASGRRWGYRMPLIVIVDDRVSNRNIFAKLAASIEADLTVRTFGDPKEALEWLETNTPDLVITDYKMPHYNGAEFIRRFRTLEGCEDIPVIVITVYEERSFRLSALEAGATDFLNSPVDHYEFVTRARNLLKLQKHQQLLSDRATTLQYELEVSERSRETALRDSSERLAQVIDTVPVMISAVDSQGIIQFANAYQAEVCGKSGPEMVGQPASVFFGAEHAARHIALDRMVFDTARPLPPFEEELVDNKSQKRVFLTNKSPLVRIDGGVSAVLTSSLDITARKRTESHLRHLALHDSLTGLPNRAYLHEAMRKLIARARRGDKLFALLVIDLDGFKLINDLLGHAAGDRYIIQLAETLRANMREEDVLVRLGGDEFAILQTDVVSGEDAAMCAARALKIIEEDVVFSEAPLKVTASIGIALHPFDGAEDEEMLKNADLAMYQAKKSTGNHFCFYASDMNARARDAALLDGRLRKAIERNEFALHYQPLVNAQTGMVIGAEALLRWNDPEKGLVSPSQFLPRAEENGLIVPINEWVLQRACLDAQQWPQLGDKPLFVSVNLSPVQFRRRTVPLFVARVLADTGLQPSRLSLELTESILIDDVDCIRNELHQIVAMGVSLSIDDFGTGYSSLSYVKRLPVATLKIDQSFVRNIATDLNDTAIIRAIVTLGQSLGLKIVAEGVETQAQAERLKEESCDTLQGYLFGRPMSQASFVRHLESFKQDRKLA